MDRDSGMNVFVEELVSVPPPAIGSCEIAPVMLVAPPMPDLAVRRGLNRPPRNQMFCRPYRPMTEGLCQSTFTIGWSSLHVLSLSLPHGGLSTPRLAG